MTFGVYLIAPSTGPERVSVFDDLGAAVSAALDLADQLGQRALWAERGKPKAVEVRDGDALAFSVQIIPGGLVVRRPDARSRSK